MDFLCLWRGGFLSILESRQVASGWRKCRLVWGILLVLGGEAWEIVPGDHMLQEEIGKVWLVDHGVRSVPIQDGLVLGNGRQVLIT